MRKRSLLLVTAIGLVMVACDGGDAELSTSSTILTSPSVTGTPTTSAPAGDDGSNGAESPDTSLVGQPVGSFEVVARFPNDNGEEQHIVIPQGGYTDIDIESFVFTLLERNPDLYGAEVFTDDAAAEAFLVPEADRSEAEQQLLDDHHLVSLIGRDSIEFRGPMSEFPGGAIGS
jgi:hypothetical protein